MLRFSYLLASFLIGVAFIVLALAIGMVGGLDATPAWLFWLGMGLAMGAVVLLPFWVFKVLFLTEDPFNAQQQPVVVKPVVIIAKPIVITLPLPLPEDEPPEDLKPPPEDNPE